MSTHIAAEPGQIAPVVLFPGDPLRAKWIAETFLDDAELYSETRGMLGFTGTWEGHRVSVQGSGMGQPSMAIYATELFTEYDVQTIVRVGSCGALTEKLAVRDIIIANGASTDSGINRVRFHGLDYAPLADFALLRAAVEASEPEPAGLYTLAAFYGRRALAICTVSDHIVTGEETTAQEREQTCGDMGRIALSAAPSD